MVTTTVTTWFGTAETERPVRLVKAASNTVTPLGSGPLWLKQFEAETVESEDDMQPTKLVPTALICSELVSVKLPWSVTDSPVGGVAALLGGVAVFVSPGKQIGDPLTLHSQY